MLALLTGTLFVALGLVMLGRTGLVTGGTAGAALLLHYATGWPFGLVFFAFNLPFYGLAWHRLGRVFALKTFAAITLLSVFSQVLPAWVEFGRINPVFAALGGGLLMGAGMLMLFRHRASLGGFNVLALYLQERWGWRAGVVQMGLDGVIVVLALVQTDAWHVLLSVLCAVALNQVLAINHRAGRYASV